MKSIIAKTDRLKACLFCCEEERGEETGMFPKVKI